MERICIIELELNVRRKLRAMKHKMRCKTYNQTISELIELANRQSFTVKVPANELIKDTQTTNENISP